MNRFNYSRSRLINQFESLQQSYNQNQPCPHLVIDDLFEPGILKLILQEFSSGCNSISKSKVNHNSSLKTKEVARLSEFGRTFYFWLNSSDFIRALTLVVNRERDSLIGDPYYYGAGIHELLSGATVESHQNLLLHKDLPLICQFNLILCLNTQKNSQWAGTIEIGSSQPQVTIKFKYSLQFNRTFILPMTKKAKYKIITKDNSLYSSKFLSIYYWALIPMYSRSN